MSVETSAVFGEASETADVVNEIPRLDRIPNPQEPLQPTEFPALDVFHADSFNSYQEFVSNILPEFDLNMLDKTQFVIDHIKADLENEQVSQLAAELIVHMFLLTCQAKQTELISSPSLTRLSHLHHSLYLVSEAIHNCSKLNDILEEHCNMMMADTADLYHSHFCEIVEHKFWGKTKSVNDLIQSMLKKEFERLRLLNNFTYDHLTLLAMRKSIDSAPSSTVNELIKWAHANNIPFE